MKGFGMLALLLCVAAAGAADKPVDPVRLDSDGLAIKGYDAVAYFTESDAVEGSPEHIYEWMGATWRFSSARNRDAFAKEPEKYAPQYGGYCAWAMSKNHTAPISPKAWTIVDGKLYLNHPLAKGKFKKETEAAISRADGYWSDYPKKPVSR